MVTPNLKPSITDDDIEAQLQDDLTHEATRRQRMVPNGVLRWGFDKATSHCVAGKSFGDPSTELWLMYLDEDESLGREICGGWQWDRDDVLVFVSSAI